MYNILTIQEAFAGLVGWRKHPNPAETLNPMGDMLLSSTGIMFQDQHALLTNENLNQTFDVFSDYTYSAWSALSTYAIGDMVTNSSRYYVSKVNGNINHAVSDTTYWRETTPFNEQLRQITLAGAAKVINDWYGLKTAMRSSRSLLKKGLVLNIPGYKKDEFDSKNWIGWRVVPTPAQDVVVTIDRICLDLNNSEECIVGLYKNGASVPEDTVTFPATGDDGPVWVSVNWPLERGNRYYVGFNRTEIGAAQPVNGIANAYRDWSFNRFPGTLPYAEVSAFEHDGPGEAGWEDTTDIQRNDNNYGLNMVISANCDYTDLIVDQVSLFAVPFAKAVAIEALRWMAMNPNARINRHKANIDTSRVLYEIEGDAVGRNGGMKKDYDMALKAVSFDDRKFSEHCLPCKRSGIRAKSA